MPLLKIICTRPGMRRAGIVHGASKTWPVEAFTAEQLALLRADPAFSVELIGDDQSDPVLGPDQPTIDGVLRLLVAGEQPATLMEEMRAAITFALERGDAFEAFRPVAQEIFARHAVVLGEVSTNPEGAPTPPPADAGPSTDGPMQAGTGDAPDNAAALATEIVGSEGVLSTAEMVEESGEASEAAAAVASEPTSSEPVSAPAKKSRTTKSTS